LDKIDIFLKFKTKSYLIAFGFESCLILFMVILLSSYFL